MRYALSMIHGYCFGYCVYVLAVKPAFITPFGEKLGKKLGKVGEVDVMGKSGDSEQNSRAQTAFFESWVNLGKAGSMMKHVEKQTSK